MNEFYIKRKHMEYYLKKYLFVLHYLQYIDRNMSKMTRLTKNHILSLKFHFLIDRNKLCILY